MQNTKLGKYTVYFLNKEEYHVLKNEIFTSDTYYFPLKTKTPLIIDIGAHIGLSTIYFKDMYPSSKILAYEPNPYTFDVLKENVFQNDLQDVACHQKAIWTKHGKAKLNIAISDEWYSTGSFLKSSWKGVQQTIPIQVHCDTLSSLLFQKVDILKIDVEGIEEKLLSEAEKLLMNVNNIVIEYHPVTGNDFGKIIETLTTAGFSIELYEEGKKIKRYLKKKLVIIKGMRI